MRRITKQNLNRIKDRFEAETGVELEPKRLCLSAGKVLLVAAVIALGAVLAAFTSPLFTPLEGDALTLEGTYLGDGIVSVRVRNDSDKVLTLEDAKLFSWNNGEVEKLHGGEVRLTDSRIEPHSEGMVTVDLSEAYDIDYLETTVPGKPKDSWHYLLLTNNSFLFGHDWMCSFHFAEEMQMQEAEPEQVEHPQAQGIGEIEEELRFYFEEAYYDVIPAFNEANFTYQQKVQELLMRTEGTFVRPVDPMLRVEHPKDGSLDDLVPLGYRSLDAYQRIVGSCFSGETSDFVFQLGGYLPAEQGQTDGGVGIPLVYLAAYEAEAVQQEGAYAFLYGRILSFGRLEENKVYEDGQYVVYDVTDLYYTDLDVYLDTFVSANDVYFDESIRTRIHNIRDNCKNRENLTVTCDIPGA